MFRRSNGKERELVTPESKKVGRSTEQPPSVLEMSSQEGGKRDFLPLIVLGIAVLLLILLVVLLLGSLDLESLLSLPEGLSELAEDLRETFNRLKRLIPFFS